jgi:hypothetical protein
MNVCVLQKASLFTSKGTIVADPGPDNSLVPFRQRQSKRSVLFSALPSNAGNIWINISCPTLKPLSQPSSGQKRYELETSGMLHNLPGRRLETYAYGCPWKWRFDELLDSDLGRPVDSDIASLRVSFQPVPSNASIRWAMVMIANIAGPFTHVGHLLVAMEPGLHIQISVSMNLFRLIVSLG